MLDDTLLACLGYSFITSGPNDDTYPSDSVNNVCNARLNACPSIQLLAMSSGADVEVRMLDHGSIDGSGTPKLYGFAGAIRP